MTKDSNTHMWVLHSSLFEHHFPISLFVHFQIWKKFRNQLAKTSVSNSFYQGLQIFVKRQQTASWKPFEMATSLFNLPLPPLFFILPSRKCKMHNGSRFPPLLLTHTKALTDSRNKGRRRMKTAPKNGFRLHHGRLVCCWDPFKMGGN